MKLKVPKLYSQRNSPWSPILLGYNTSTYTIGTDGCLITTLGMYVDKTPKEVNDILIAGGGYAPKGGLFDWSKSSLLGINQVYQSPYYSDAVTSQGLSKMKSLLDEGRPLVCHIDFNPGTPKDDMHWVLVYGYDDNDVFYVQDPWTGTQINLDVYGGVKRAVLEWRSYDKILPKDEGVDLQAQLSQSNHDRDVNWNYFSGLCDVMKVAAVFETAKSELEKLVGIEDKYNQTSKSLDSTQKELSEVKMRVGLLTDSHNALQTSYNDLQGQLNTDKATIDTLTTNLKELEDKIVQPVYKGWKKALIDFIGKL